MDSPRPSVRVHASMRQFEGQCHGVVDQQEFAYGLPSLLKDTVGANNLQG